MGAVLGPSQVSRITAWRVFFPLAALWAMAWPVAPMLMSQGVGGHSAALVAGLAGAAIAGYALTALPGWDGGAPVGGVALTLLAVAWLAGVMGVIVGTAQIFWPFALGLAALLARRRHGKGRRWMVAVAVIVLAGLVGQGLSEQAVFLVAALVSGIGARAVPAFLASAAGRHPQTPPVDALLLPPLVVASLFWPAMGLLAGLAVVAQMRGWPVSGMRLAGVMLVGAWLWLAAGLFLWGGAGVMSGGPDRLLGLHALSMGAMGGMIMAIGGRVAFPRRHAIPVATPLVSLAVLAVWVAAILRLLGGDGPVLIMAAGLWSFGWLLWLVALWPHLRGPAIRPAFSGARHQG